MAKKLLRFEDVVWNISGLFTHDAAILFFYDLIKQCGAPIRMSVHGNIPCLWNSGRIVKSVSEQYQRQILDEYSSRNIPVFLTCSNYLVTNEGLHDRLSNQILDLVAQYPDFGVISGSELLSKYIRGKYPEAMISSSILRVVHEDGRGRADYYNRLLSEYDLVVLHPDDGFQEGLIKKLHLIKKVEIIINENCVLNCTARKEHCNIVSEYYLKRRSECVLERLKVFKREKCLSIQNPTAIKEFMNGNRRICNMSIDELQTCYRLGCRHYKIQGRSLSVASLLYDITRYILEDDVAQIIYKMMMDRLGSFAYSQDEQVFNVAFRNWERI